jgi:hypothetical protein
MESLLDFIPVEMLDLRSNERKKNNYTKRCRIHDKVDHSSLEDGNIIGMIKPRIEFDRTNTRAKPFIVRSNLNHYNQPVHEPYNYS